MNLASPTQPQPYQQHPDWLVQLGGRLFTWRTSLPLPIVVALIAIPGRASVSDPLFWTGVACVLGGELLRLWAVRQIGVISRTRSERLGPLVASGPFALVRNPLYVGNVLLWVGFTLSAGLTWLVPVVALLLAFVYHAIVTWEEQLLTARLGDSYRNYLARVPRWLPHLIRAHAVDPSGHHVFSWSETLFSERGTLIAIAAGYLVFWMKSYFVG